MSPHEGPLQRALRCPLPDTGRMTGYTEVTGSHGVSQIGITSVWRTIRPESTRRVGGLSLRAPDTEEPIGQGLHRTFTHVTIPLPGEGKGLSWKSSRPNHIYQ